MIIIPVMGRTRSSLVAGIFNACGAWVGDTTVSMVRKYDAFENWDVIMYLQKKFALRQKMTWRNVERYAPEFKEFVESVVPHDQVICLKFVWYYEPLFRAAFPDSDYFFVKRTDNWNQPKPFDRQIIERPDRFRQYANAMGVGTWIDSHLLRDGDFSQMQDIVSGFSSLNWNQKAIDKLIQSNGDEKFEHTRRMRR